MSAEDQPLPGPLHRRFPCMTTHYCASDGWPQLCNRPETTINRPDNSDQEAWRSGRQGRTRLWKIRTRHAQPATTPLTTSHAPMPPHTPNQHPKYRPPTISHLPPLPPHMSPSDRSLTLNHDPHGDSEAALRNACVSTNSVGPFAAAASVPCR